VENRVLIRTADPSEAEALTALALRSKRAWGYGRAFMAAVLPDMIVHPEYLRDEYGAVAEQDGKILGYAVLRVDNEVAFLRDLFVEPDRFRSGIGKTLFLHVTDYARDRGAKKLRLVGDPNALGFYKRLGMTQVGEEPSIVGARRVLPIMELDLILGNDELA
jgi:GNAT superfamily N-acetyltransferase